MATNMRGLTQVSWPSPLRISLATVSHHLPPWFLGDLFRIRNASRVQFIADIRGARVRELEEKRINKEMANIRKKFKGQYGFPTLSVGATHKLPYRRKFGWLSEEKVRYECSRHQDLVLRIHETDM